MAATVGNERSRLRGRWAISEASPSLKKRDCGDVTGFDRISQKLGTIRQNVRCFPVGFLDSLQEHPPEILDLCTVFRSYEVKQAWELVLRDLTDVVELEGVIISPVQCLHVHITSMHDKPLSCL
jgi:hypothetical protein